MTPIIILDVSQQPFLSVGPETDAYVRKDYIKKLKAMKWPKFVEYVKTVEQ